MAESNNTKKNKKGLISENDVSLVLMRYDAPTILAVLQEVAQFPDVKIDWNALVKKTSSGISNAREYQMLWRHLAYCDTLAEKVEEAEPLDDDSDLEYELEAFPPVTEEASVEAAACVKVLLASGLPDVSGPQNRATVEGPLTINIPNGQASRNPSNNPQPSCSKGTNITVSVSVQKQPLPTVTTTEGLDGSGTATGNATRKWRRWTLKEDMELIAAVNKWGERNWTNILKGDFKGDRTAIQLAQRWSIIRKRLANFNPGGVSNPTVPQLTSTQLATRNALSRALNMPGYSFSAVGATNSVTPAVPAALTDAAAVSVAPSEANANSSVSNSIAHQYQHAPLQTATSLPKGKAKTNIATAKSRVPPEKASSIPVKSHVGPNPMIQAAAVAAGARIVTHSSAVAVALNHSVPRPNVHYICTSVPPPASTYSSVVPSLPLPPAVTAPYPFVSAPTSASCRTSAEGKITSAIKTAGVGNSSKEEEIKPAGHSLEGEIKPAGNSSKEEEIKPAEEMDVDSSAEFKNSLKADPAALPDTEIVNENQTAENLEHSSKDEVALAMDVDNNQIESETANKTNSPAGI